MARGKRFVLSAAVILAITATAVAVIVWVLQGEDQDRHDADRVTWRDGTGRALPGETADGFGVAMFSGAEHCGWEEVTFLQVAWPPGAVVTSYRDVRQFVRDREGVFDGLDNLRSEHARDVEPPRDAVATGVHTDDVELWTAESDPDGIYLRTRDGSFDRWPRAEPHILCL
jgi:hypothetical protein